MSKLVIIIFFQAEDGIRDLTVTGVQTCALPISPRETSASSGRTPYDLETRSRLIRLLMQAPCWCDCSSDLDDLGPGDRAEIGRASCRERVRVTGYEVCVMSRLCEWYVGGRLVYW